MRSETREPGAPATAGMIPLAVPNISGHEWAYVKDCLDTGWVSSVGDYVTRFETGLAAYVGAKHGVAVASGTAALHLALQLSGISRDEEVVMPSLTFIAPANALRYVGAWPVFVDVDAEFWQLDPNQLEAFLREDCTQEAGGLRNRRTGRRVSGVLPVDTLGHPCDLEPILLLAREFGLAVVEDACESLGAHYRDRPLGQWSPITCFSFNGNKTITTGGGGMIVTDDGDFARKGRYFATQAKDDPVEYVHGAVGYNYRLTNVQAAVGCAQLECLDAFIERKRAIAQRYTETLQSVPGITPMNEAPWVRSAFWLFTVLVDEARYGMDSRRLLRTLDECGVQTRPLWQPLHRSPAHTKSYARSCPVAERLSRDALSLPSSTNLTEQQQESVIAAVRRYAQASD